MLIKISEVTDWIVLLPNLYKLLIINAHFYGRVVYFFDTPLDLLQKGNKFRTFALCKTKFPLL